ncbi:hypothetical protein X943_003609 [Babesia divergens]|uniref:Uncharacterized protein n=1 Tax=Babesia divergens TaxID=32595 RepID=A0AAD9GLD6_BABDI|nr:hypothetical protein X943_003609 [Babesia divergens]
MAGLTYLISQLIVCIIALRMAEPVIAESMRKSEETQSSAEPMTYEAWLEFCKHVSTDMKKAMEVGELKNAAVTRIPQSKIITEAFSDVEVMFKTFTHECGYMVKLRDVEPHVSDGSKPDAQKKLDQNANMLGRKIAESCVALQHAFDVYVVVRKFEEMENNQRDAVDYLKRRLAGAIADGFSHVITIFAMLSPVLFSVLY